MLRLTLDKSPAVKLDAKLYSADDNVKLNSTRRGKRSKVGIFEVSEGGGVCFFLGILFQFGVEETMNGKKGLRMRMRMRLRLRSLGLVRVLLLHWKNKDGMKTNIRLYFRGTRAQGGSVFVFPTLEYHTFNYLVS